MEKNFSISNEVASTVSKIIIEELSKDGDFRMTLTVSRAAKALGINIVKMYEIVRTDNFPSIVLGNRILIPILPFIDWMEKTAWDKAS